MTLNTVSLRRVESPPDRSTAGLRQLESFDSTEGEFMDNVDKFTVYESPCTTQVSNDFFSPSQLESTTACDRLFYGGCITDFEDFNAADFLKIDVKFDYELHVQSGANQARTLTFLEAAMLEHLASFAGLTDCTKGIRESSRRKLQTLELNTRNVKVEGISSSPVDEVDSDIDSCTILVEGPTLKNSVCQAYHGLFSVYLSSDTPLSSHEEDEIRIKLLRVVRSGMDRDVYTTGSIRKLAFVGNRPNDADSRKTTSIGVGEEQLARNPRLAKYTLVILVTYAVLAVLYIVFKYVQLRKRRKHQVHNDEIPQSSDPPMITSTKIEKRQSSDDAPTVPGSLALRDMLALADSATTQDYDTIISEFDDVSSLSSGGSDRLPSAVTSSVISSDLIVPGSTFDIDACPATPPATPIEDNDQNILNNCGGDIMGCLNTIPEDQADDEIIQMDETDDDEIQSRFRRIM